MEPGFGLVVIEDRITSDWASDADSSYTEAGPTPGHPVASSTDSDFRPYASGAQTRDVTVRTVRAGYPARDGMAVAVRLGSETSDDDYRGWEEPVLITDCRAASVSSVIDVAVGVLPDTQEIVLTLVQFGTAISHVYNPATQAFRASSPYNWGMSQNALGDPVACFWDPESERLSWLSCVGSSAERFVLYQAADRDFTGAVNAAVIGWADSSIQAQLVNPGTTTADVLTVAARRGGAWSAFWYRGTQGITLQMVSNDRGATWSLVETIADSVAHSTKVIATDNGFVVCYANATPRAAVRILANANSKFSDADEEIVASVPQTNSNPQAVALCRDADGILYCLWALTSSTVTAAARSLNGGQSWSNYADKVIPDDVSVYKMVAAGGKLHLVAKNGALLSLGGWSNVEHGTRDDFDDRRTERFGWGGVAGPADPSAVYLAAYQRSDPTSYGFTKFSVGSPVTEATTTDGWQMTASAAGPTYYTSGTGTSRSRVVGWAAMQLVSGGGTRSTSTTQGAIWRCCDADAVTTGSIVQVCLFSDGFVVRDNVASTTLADVATSAIGVDHEFRIQMEGLGSGSGCLASVWYRIAGDSNWVKVVDDVTLASGTTNNAVIRWGILGSTTAVIAFRAVAISAGAFHFGAQDPTEIHAESNESTRGLAWGRALLGDASYPCPALVTPGDAVDMGRLSVSGYARAGESVAVPVRYEYGIGQIMAGDSPSPRAQWRATGTAEFVLAWNWADYESSGGARWLGEVIGLVVMQARPRQWQLQYHTGSAWSTIGTLDLAVGTGLTFLRVGNALRPNGGTAIDRYIDEGELVGGYVVSGATAAAITRNSGGYWASSGQPIRIEIESGSSVPSSGTTLQIIAPSGVAVFSAPAAPPDRIRLRAVSGQVVPGTYRCGVAGIGRVVGIGADPGWGWRRQREFSRQLTRRADEFLDIVATGPARTRLTYDWPDGVLLRSLNSVSSGLGETVAYGTGEIVGTAEDAHTISEIISGQLDQGRVPCVVVPRLPALGSTMTNPRGYCYGRILTDSHGIQGIVGTEGDDEVVRVDGFTLEELR